VIVSPFCTIGPFYPFELVDEWSDLTNSGRAVGVAITLRGRVLEDGGVPTRNSIVEIWQPDARGILHHPDDRRYVDRDPHFRGFGRARTDAQGWYELRTVIPGASAERAPHINVAVLAIGLTRRGVTTAFFSDAADPVLQCVPEARRHLLIVTPQADGTYLFDIRLRGENETPFFAD
jgi:protocatechuate 3,4-dioxygenase alpha subunit